MSQTTYHLFFNNLSNRLRINIVSCLKDKESSVSELGQILKTEQSKLSHALSSLRKCNLVHVRQRGKERIYSLNKKTLLPILKIIDRHSHDFCRGNCKNCKYHEK